MTEEEIEAKLTEIEARVSALQQALKLTLATLPQDARIFVIRKLDAYRSKASEIAEHLQNDTLRDGVDIIASVLHDFQEGSAEWVWEFTGQDEDLRILPPEKLRPY